MKRFVLYLGLLLIPQIIIAGWTRTYGDQGNDQGYCVYQSTDGGFVVAGYSESQNSLWLLKIDSSGDTVWTVASQQEWPNGRATSVIQASDGSFLITGYAAPLWDGRFHLIISKIDEHGEVLWTRGDWDWFEIPPGSMGFSIQETADNGYIVTGATTPAFDEIEDLLLIKIDSSGDTLWTRTYGGAAPDCGCCVRETSDGGYIIAGYTTSALPWSFWILKTDENGDTLWNSGMPDWWFGRAYSITETSDDGYIATGYVAPFEDGKYHLMLLKIGSDGDTLWSRMDFELLPDEPGGTGRCIKPTADGNYILAGYTTGFLDEIEDLLLIKLTPDGDTVWTRTYGGEAEDMGYFVDQTADGGYIVTGTTRSFGAGEYDIWLLKTDARGDTLGIHEQPVITPPSSWSVDNQVGREITLRYFNYSCSFHAAVFDASGRKVDELHSTLTTGSITWPVSPQAPGVYFITETSSPGLTRRIILVK